MSTILKYKLIVSLEKVTTLVNNQWAFVQQMPDDTMGMTFNLGLIPMIGNSCEHMPF